MEGVVVTISSDSSVHLKMYVHALLYLILKLIYAHYSPSGVVFSVPPESVQVRKLDVGDVVTFSYESNARRDVPIGPKIYRIRTDLSWREVVANTAAEKKFLNGKISVLIFI